MAVLWTPLMVLPLPNQHYVGPPRPHLPLIEDGNLLEKPSCGRISRFAVLIMACVAEKQICSPDNGMCVVDIQYESRYGHKESP